MSHQSRSRDLSDVCPRCFQTSVDRITMDRLISQFIPIWNVVEAVTFSFRMIFLIFGLQLNGPREK